MRRLMDALTVMDGSALVEALKGFYGFISLLTAEVVVAIETARHDRDHNEGDGTMMVQGSLTSTSPSVWAT